MSDPISEQRLAELEAKWLNGTINPQEAQEYARWYNEGQDEPVYIPPAIATSREDHRMRLLTGIYRRITPVRYLRRRWIRAASIAAILLLVCWGTWVLLFQKKPEQNPVTARLMTRDIAPGHNGAVLTLSNGQQITLDSAGNGIVATDRSVQVIKKGGQVSYHQSLNGLNTSLVTYNTITTAKGRQWQLTLPDGTKVWLNAASSIKYPIAFTGSDREVEVTGEAYFEVKHNARQPFKVKVGTQEIEDIGTAFNVNAYTDEPVMKTTLVEGSVRVSITNNHSLITHHSSLITSTRQLSIPGDQAELRSDGKLKVVTDVDVEQITAWKNGSFVFRDSDLKTIMRQLARWYDVDVVYEDGLPERYFTADMARNKNLSAVLKILEFSKIHFKIEGKQLIVMP